MDFRVLGALDVVDADGVSVAPRAERQRRLLAALLLDVGQHVSADRLVDVVWGGAELPEDALRSLRTYVSRLRTALDGAGAASVLLGEADGYRLAVPEEAVDAHRFTRAVELAQEHLRAGHAEDARMEADRALGWWRGPAYAEFSDLPAFKPDAVRLEELRLVLIELRNEALLVAGRPAEVIAEAEGLVRAEPLREVPRRQLMTALHAVGRQAEALATFVDYRRLLADEMGLDASAELAELQERIARSDGAVVPEGAVAPAMDAAVRRGSPPRRPERRPDDLPVHLTSFVGRARELVELSELLDLHALVTLTGVGGCGKTRLAVEVAAERREERPDGVFFVDLSSLSDPALVPRTTADAVGLKPEGGPADELLVEALASHDCLIVLDNCEHLLDACAELAAQLLTSCPQVRVLATSREPLGVDGEQVYPVPSLSLPEADADDGASEAVELFVDRARRADPDFQLDPDSARAVVEVCRRLDGIPLAIEFAAARVTHLSVEQIAERLDDRFRLLTGGRRRVRRQQTLEAALEWSHALLDYPQQALLRRLAVFVGSFSLEMAEQVCSGGTVDGAAVLDLLGGLVEKSLVATETTGGEARYRLLETVRSYAAERLTEAGETQTYRARHRDAYLSWLESTPWEAIYAGAMLRALVRELPNLRAALEWSKAHRRRDLVGRMAARAITLWWFEGYAEEGRQWLEWALAEPDSLDRVERAACHTALAATMTAHVFRAEELEEHAARAVELGGRSLGGLVVEALGLRALGAGIRLRVTGDEEVAEQARSLAQQAVELADELGSPWTHIAWNHHGETMVQLGEITEAESSFTRAIEGPAEVARSLHGYVAAHLATCRILLGDPRGAVEAAARGVEAGPPGLRPLSFSFLTAALAEVHLGERAAAAEHLREALDLADPPFIPRELNECLVYTGAMAQELGDPHTASRLVAAGVHVGAARTTGVPFRTVAADAIYRHYVALVRGALDPEEARRCRDDGRAMTREDAVAAVRAFVDTLRT